MRRVIKFTRTAVLRATLFSVMLAVLVVPHQVSASSGGCITDPTAVLTDGTHVRISATVATGAANISTIAYTIHGPVGSSLAYIVYTQPHLVNETFAFQADAPAGTYGVDVVASSPVRVAVIVTIHVLSALATSTGTTNHVVSTWLEP